jgi:tetratricopeptide (TPR) repeat protein
VADSERALAVVRRLPESPYLIHVVLVCAEVYRRWGRLHEALAMARRCMVLACEMKNNYSLSYSIGNVGAIRAVLGDYGPALRLLTAALALKKTDHPLERAENTMYLGYVYRETGRLELAEATLRQALAAIRDGGDRHTECEVLNELAKTLLRAGRITDALATHRRALELAERHDYLIRRADAHTGLGHCLAQSQPAEARRYWEQALTLYRRLDLPQQHAVAAELARHAAGGPRVDSEPRAETKPRAGTAPLQRRMEVTASRPSC